MKRSKQALFHSIVALILCLSMFVGTTFALFSENVSSGSNLISSGNLRVKMYWTADLAPESGDPVWTDASEGTLFGYANWEPGYTDLKYLKVENVGSLAFQYELNILPYVEPSAGNTQSGTSPVADALKLAEVIDVYVGTVNGEFATRQEAVAGLTKVGNLYDLIQTGRGAAQGIILPESTTASVSIPAADAAVAKTGSETLCIMLKMREDAGNAYMNLSAGDGFRIQLKAVQYTYEEDSFGNDYDSAVRFPELIHPVSESAAVTVVNGATAEAVTMGNEQGGATVPAGVAVADGTTQLTLTITEKSETESNVTLGTSEAMRSLDVHMEGVSPDNTVPMIINMGPVMPAYQNMGNVKLYHVENGVTNAMTQVNALEELDTHNEFYYDAATGSLTVALATFSEIATVADTENKWQGGAKTDWYNTTDTEFVLYNADQLAGFGQIVGGMASGIKRDSFSGKTITLISDIDLNDAEDDNHSWIFSPIGYYYNATENEGKPYSTVYSFEGTFDGNGHTISNFYQNTWEIKGDYDAGYYKDGMGLFGYVNGGTVQNLTVHNFKSDGEFTPTGVIAAFAVDATFENIAITSCNPRVYNTGNGGIVGIGGNSDDPDSYKLTFDNITIDNTNKISALWGSWDVACGGLMGMFRGDGKVEFTNCHVAAQIDVYNDVCGNYQYYWYRYSGMMIGSLRGHNTTDANGYTVPDTSMIKASGCTVHFGEWNDYYYCEFVDNSLASYTHDHQFSRVDKSEIIFDENGKAIGCKHDHTLGGYETTDINGDGVIDSDVLKEDKTHVYLPFNQLFQGDGWGVKHIPVYNGEDYAFEGITILDREVADSVEKFDLVFPNTADYLYRVGTQNTVAVSSLFKAKSGVKINGAGVHVTVTSMYDDSVVMGTFTENENSWGNGQISFTKTGPVKVTIQDYDYCVPTVLYLEVVDAKNITTATGSTGTDVVLLDNVTFTGGYLYYNDMTLYGNGFEIDITGADHSDLRDTSDTNSNKSAYCNIWMVDSTFDNVRIKGSVYPKVGMTADSDYGNAAIRTEGNCYIYNSYVSNCRVPLRVQGNTTVVDTVVDGGRYANIELRSGKLTLDGVTTINTVRKGSDGTTDVIGFGIVIHDEAANASIAVVGDGLKQNNWVGENKHKSILSGDTNLSSAYKLIFNANNSDTIYFDYDNDRYVNTGILCLCADINKDAVTGLDDRYCQEVSGYNAWVLTYDNSKHTDWFNESVGVETVQPTPNQNAVLPTYTGNEAQTVEFTKGETYYFDTSVLKAEKNGNTLEISSVVLNGTTYNYGEKIALTEGGVYEVVYTVVDPYNYNADATETTTVNHTVSITVTAIAKDAEILAPKFTFIDQNGNKYESTKVKVGDKTYVMPNVTAADPTTNSMSSINIGSASISGTTVYFPIATGKTVRSGSNFNRYYPLFNGINITDYTIAGDTTGTTYTTSGNYTSLVGSSGTKFIIPANGGQTNCGDYVKTDGQAGNAAGNSDSGWQGAGYSTSYGGTYLKSGNTNASSGADSNGYERIVWVEYCFNAGNGDVYYYRIGYHCNKESAQSCFTSDTLITLADGSQKRIDELTFDDKILAWDFFTGEYVEQDIALLVNHGEELYQVANLEFSDGTKLGLIGDHGVFDYDLNKYVYITVDNMHDYIGHRFVQQNLEGGYNIVTLEKAYMTEEVTNAYSITSAGTSNTFASGMLTVAPPDDFYNWIEMDGKLRYDAEQFAEDVETYGLYTYDVFKDYVTYEQFVAFNGAYLKIPVEKGLFTFDYILELIDLYAAYMPQ